MSTYLLAFAIHDYESISALTKSNKKVNVWLPSEQLEYGKFAIEVAPRALELFEQLFNISYPLEKLDLIGIPGFEAGAMENWGLITFRMSSFMINDKISNDWTKQMVGETITHEIAHQWFGNLVTMEWWSDIWLNEGFATFMEFYGMDILFPEWKMMDQLAYRLTLSGMTYDQLSVTHPVSLKNDEVDNIHLMFDHISYNKGAAILNMLMNTVGNETFIKGIQIYLKNYMYGNSVSKDLWAIFSNITDNKIIENMMLEWTQLTGYPILTVSHTNITGVVNISQSRALISADNSKKESVEKSSSIWPIPINYITASNPQNSSLVWLTSKSATFNVTTQDEWIKMNYKFKYFYRTNYDLKFWRQLIDQLSNNSTIFSSLDRMSLVSDVFTNTRLNNLPVDVAMNLTLYLTNETNYFVISEALHNFKYIHRFLSENSTSYTLFNNYILYLLQDLYNQLGWELKKDRFQRMLQVTVLSSYVHFNNKEAVEKARALFVDYLQDRKTIQPDYIGFILCAGLKNASEEEWDQILRRYMDSKDPLEKNVLLVSLSCSHNVKLLEKLLSLSINETVIGLQDLSDVIEDVASNRNGVHLAWEFVKSNWNLLRDKLRDVPNTFSKLVSATAGKLKTRADFTDVKVYFSKYKEDYLTRSINEALESIGNSIKWVEEHMNELDLWLSMNRFPN